MKEIIKQYLGVSFGIFCIAFSINIMFAPNGLAPGGTGGIGIILEELFGFNISISVLIMNACMLIVGLLLLGKDFFFKTAFGTLLLPALLAIIPQVSLTDDKLLSVIFGALIIAVGMNVLYHFDASSGGTTIPPLLLKKYFGMNQALGLFVSDALVVFASLFVFGIETFLYSTLVVMLTSVIMELIVNGLSNKKLLYIISNNIDEIAQDIFSDVGRGVTKLHAQGAYSKKEKDVLMIVLNNRDLLKIEKIAYYHDPKAFLIIQPVSKVTGDAFTYHSVVA